MSNNFYGNYGYHQGPIFRGPPPFSNSPRMPHIMAPFSPRGPPMMRGMSRRGRGGSIGSSFKHGQPQNNMFRPGMSSHPYMKNKSFPCSSQLGSNTEEHGNETPFRPIDMFKPWVTKSIESEFCKKEELLKKAKATKQQEDWSIFREQRNKFSNIYRNAEVEYNRNKDSDDFEVNEFHENMEDMEQSRNSSQISNLACDSCDRNFPSSAAFEKHMSEHKVCGLEGCTFSAHEKIIQKHIEMQHSTGIFKRMGNLDSPENIAKWIEERKKKFPSKENVENRQKQQEELWKRGIRIGERKNKFGRDKTRLERKDPQTWRKEREIFFQKKKEKREKFVMKLQPKLMIDDKHDWNCGLQPFKGIKELLKVEQEEPFQISDDEEDYGQTPAKEESVPVNSSLGALMAYGSDCSEDEDNVEVTKVDKSSKRKKNSDDEGPLEVKTEKTTAPTQMDKQKKPNAKRQSGRKKNNKVPNEFKRRKISQLERILDEDIRNERNIILQCVRYTVENDFFANHE